MIKQVKNKLQMKQLKYLVIHCTATPEGRAVSKQDIIHWHTSPKHLGGRGWNRPGYSDLIYLDGSLINIQSFNQDNLVNSWEITNGAKGFNTISRHVAYVGGLDKSGKHPKDTRTTHQLHTMETYIRYTLRRNPDLVIAGHNQLTRKACPGFDVPKWLRSIGIDNKNIFTKK